MNPNGHMWPSYARYLLEKQERRRELRARLLGSNKLWAAGSASVVGGLVFLLGVAG